MNAEIIERGFDSNGIYVKVGYIGDIQGHSYYSVYYLGIVEPAIVRNCEELLKIIKKAKKLKENL